MYDLKDIMQGAWNVARFQAAKSGKTARAHLAEALKAAWHVARRHAEEPKAPTTEETRGVHDRLRVSHIPASLVAEFVGAGGKGITFVGPRSVWVEGRDAVYAVCRPRRRAEELRREGLNAGMEDGTVRYASKADLRRQAAAPKWEERIVVGVSAMNPDTAPATIEREGRTLSLTGYGKVWRHYDSSDCSVYGVHPSYDRVRYAYYA